MKIFIKYLLFILSVEILRSGVGCNSGTKAKNVTFFIKVSVDIRDHKIGMSPNHPHSSNQEK